MKRKGHLPSLPQSRTWKDGSDEGTAFELTSAGSDDRTGKELTSSVMKRETTRTTARTVKGFIIDVELIQDD